MRDERPAFGRDSAKRRLIFQLFDDTLESRARLRKRGRGCLLHEIIENGGSPDSKDAGDKACRDERTHRVSPVFPPRDVKQKRSTLRLQCPKKFDQTLPLKHKNQPILPVPDRKKSASPMPRGAFRKSHGPRPLEQVYLH
jgi:hypothetical protein